MSVFWKPLHRLLNDGNPIDPVTILMYDLGDEQRLPFAAVARTRGNRLILWPPSHAKEPHEFTDANAMSIHHVTLDLSSGRTHFTEFESGSRRVHENRGWGLASFDAGLKLWLIGAFQIAYLEKQIGVVGERIRMPTTDSKRREDEFRRYGEQMQTVLVKTPPLRAGCLITVIHLLPDSSRFRGPIERSYFPMGSFWNDWIEGWQDGDIFPVAGTVVSVGGVNLLLLTAAPLGRLKGECYVGGHNRRHNTE